ncbi:putative yqeB [Bacillus pseudomycoides]|uniref:YqeB family protein n=1 Tax=Bacillus TaxID=1386 RepID=UPI00036B5A8A|nr:MULTISPECIES: 50S ribosomal protein L29 [Bacillus]AIK39330.1 putative yqeB [Bacillus pseudomycoides]AJI19977.1 putative yqeB [Bacillus pseudomycoides]MEB3056567.1 hypothetical protein [Bacillus pseudomycoides]
MRDNKTVIGLSKFEKTLVIFIPIILGGLVGWFIPVIANWILKLPVVPMEKLFLFITSFNSLWVSIVASIIGIIIGMLLTLTIFDESLEVTISYTSLQLKLGDTVNTLEKSSISTIYMEDKQFIILGKNGNELYRAVIETKKGTVREALHNYHYPWEEKDPFHIEYQRWALGHPDFPEKINALLHARELALKEKKADTAKYLREDLAKLGVVIRDEKNGQYVRLIKDASDEG